MKTAVLLAALSLLMSACTTPPPVTGTFATKAGQIKVHPDGRFEIIIEPRTAK
jgi:starvation-inducible outer membrane lipoprotein